MGIGLGFVAIPSTDWGKLFMSKESDGTGILSSEKKNQGLPCQVLGVRDKNHTDGE